MHMYIVQYNVVLPVTAVQVPRTSMMLTGKRSRPQERFPGLFVGPEHLWSRLLGHIQGDGHVMITKQLQGDSIVLNTACEARVCFSPFVINTGPEKIIMQ